MIRHSLIASITPQGPPSAGAAKGVFRARQTGVDTPPLGAILRALSSGSQRTKAPGFGGEK
jgi:hypothetical protein